MLIRDGRLYGIQPHPGPGVLLRRRWTARRARPCSRPNEQAGYGGKPEVAPAAGAATATPWSRMVKDRQDFELKAFDAADGKLLHALRSRRTGDFGEHGRASATVQNGGLALLGKNDLRIARGAAGE